ncbi:hypothetical protein [Kocuria atrinae]|uniref:hypothetical protein n=1 Tax=Kocuria atrinae TaxID=592377 RepID=UPI0002EFF5C6|nr:hypothetical protein [Kocuria atrinae]
MEFIQADRDHPKALASVTGRAWDAVVDLTSHPRHAREAASRLTASHRIFVSTTSVYVSFEAPDQDEDAAVAAPLEADLMTAMDQYPAAKRRCELTYLDVPDPVTVIRPGLIGGAGDESGRSGYYPWRFAHPTGPDVIVPDDSFPVALIDVEDLAAWILRCAEQRITGVFNAAGTPHVLRDVVDASIDITRSTARPRVVDDATLDECGISRGPACVAAAVGAMGGLAIREHCRLLPGSRPGPEPPPAARHAHRSFADGGVQEDPPPGGLSDGEEICLRAALH